ncbi:testis-expressed protein 10 homolog isoform X3 [Amborella trichopoda]|uniref:testis-expressed protein 10 homolog isoform X3 n=1 Tax=Amborella trichopoda TaxID=13333 RepID=UPI0009C01C02|nr:testis-expressed protein 10 homolog isoform X3 [Amborella trichopoda]|eukprot:XP_020528524.1 testis-expressed protein 10 homolog isoform X3 [Amborella trichopoda]
MVRPKPRSSKKSKQGGVDFKKVKHKVGRKLPPPKNVTNLTIKSKAIILPEQSVATEKEGLSVNSRRQTLKELLMQTQHHNRKIRRDALIGMGDLALQHPKEIALHKFSVIEYLSARISDPDNVVRERLYQLLESRIFPLIKEDIYRKDRMGPYRLGLPILKEAHPGSSLIQETDPNQDDWSKRSYLKVLDNYMDILQNNQSCFQDKSKLKAVSTSLVHFLSSLVSYAQRNDSSIKHNANWEEVLHEYKSSLPNRAGDSSIPTRGLSSICSKLQDLVAILLDYWEESRLVFVTTTVVDTLYFDCMLNILQCINLSVKFAAKDRKYDAEDYFGFNNNHSPFIKSDGGKWFKCSFPVLSKKLLGVFPLCPSNHLTLLVDSRFFILNIGIAEIFLTINQYVEIRETIVETFLQFIEFAFCAKVSQTNQSLEALHDKHVVALLPFIPQLIETVNAHWRARIRKAFTELFEGCKAHSVRKLVCLSAIGEMLPLIQKQDISFPDSCDLDMCEYLQMWLNALPKLLWQLGHSHPSVSKVVLHLLLRIGQCAKIDSFDALAYDKMQVGLIPFFSLCSERSKDQGKCSYGPFIRLPRDCQELAICCLYYVSSMSSLLLESLARCCLCNLLDRHLVFRIMEVVQAVYRAGHLKIENQISFLVTLIASYDVNFEARGSLSEVLKKASPEGDYNKLTSSFDTYRAITKAVISCLLEMGDPALVLNILLPLITHEMANIPPLDNMSAMLSLVVVLDCEPGKLTKEILITLQRCLPGYLINVASKHMLKDDGPAIIDCRSFWKYCIWPCFYLFNRNYGLLSSVLKSFGSATMPCSHTASDQSNKVLAIAQILVLMHKDTRFFQGLSPCKADIMSILRNIIIFQAENGMNMTSEERRKTQNALHELKILTCKLHQWDVNDLERISKVM